MKERPVLFNGEMVRAILVGQKTQTRRVIKPQPTVTESGAARWSTHDGPQVSSMPRRVVGGSAVTMADLIGEYCPYGQPGDRLWVRETWMCDEYGRRHQSRGMVHYRADAESLGTWRPSIFMPRWASRITLEVTGVRVEQVQDISREDAIHEGVTTPMLTDSYRTLIGGFTELWDSINEKRGYGWDSNPWVWALTFRLV